MNLSDSFDEILKYCHFWNWSPDWDVVIKVYEAFPQSYSVLTPFAYSYLEELIRSTTSEYGYELRDEKGNPKKRRVGNRLINLAIEENKPKSQEFVDILEEMKTFFWKSITIFLKVVEEIFTRIIGIMRWKKVIISQERL